MLSSPLRRINLVLAILTCLLTVALLKAEPTNAQQPKFLYRPHYGAWLGSYNARFDHQFPDYNFFGDSNVTSNFVNSAGTVWTPPPALVCPNCYSGHDGYDYNLVYEPVVSAANGVVTYSGWHTTDHEQWLGLMIRVNHYNDHETTYGHLSAIRTQTGQTIERWQIGTSGDTGNTTGPHLHFAVRVREDANSAFQVTDPAEWTGGIDPWEVRAGVDSGRLWLDNPTQNPPIYSGPYYIIDDDTLPNTNFSHFCTSGGDFWETAAGIGVDDDVHWTLANGTAQDCWARWQVSLPSTGQYEVYVHVPAWNANLTHAARYTIHHQGGQKVVIVDQHDVAISHHNWVATDQWISLGRYNFNSHSPTTQFLTVSDSAYIAGNHTDPTNRRIVADAARWIRTYPQ